MELINEGRVTVPDLVWIAGDVCPVEALTPRESQILQMMVDGCNCIEIADALCLGEKTIRKHQTAIYSKLGVQHALQAVQAARRLGIVPTDDQPATVGEALAIARRYLELAQRLTVAEGKLGE